MQKDFDKSLHEIMQNNTSGSRLITARASSLFRKLISREDVSRSVIINRLRNACRYLERSHSSMAAVSAFCDSIILILDSAPPLGRLVEKLNNILDKWNDLYLERLALEMAAQIYPMLKEADVIVCHSYSSTVLGVLKHVAKRRKNLKVYQSISYPIKEGANMAGLLADLGYRVELIADGGLAAAVQQSDLVLLGADSINYREVLNKQGTLGLVLAAQFFEVPVYVLADSTKFIPGQVLPVISPQNPDELYVSEKQKFEITNIYFDITPLELITGVVSEKNTFAPEAIRGMLSPGVKEDEAQTSQEKTGI